MVEFVKHVHLQKDVGAIGVQLVLDAVGGRVCVQAASAIASNERKASTTCHFDLAMVLGSVSCQWKLERHRTSLTHLQLEPPVTKVRADGRSGAPDWHFAEAGRI